jgi:hypothetical protein
MGHPGAVAPYRRQRFLLFALLALDAACATPRESSPDAGTLSAPVDAASAPDTSSVSQPGPPDATPTVDASPADATAIPMDARPPSPARRTPAEVLLVVNANSPTSAAIGSDYAQKRGITNVVMVQCADSAVSADSETIAFSDFNSLLASPITNYLASHPAIDFIVLTKGVPIRIDGAPTGCCMSGGPPGQPSVDSFLAAIDYPTLSGATQIGISGSGTVGIGWLNRYWNAAVPFHHAQFGGYLVTRLDGYTQADAMSLVAGALAAEQGVKGSAAMFDVDNTHGLGDKTAAPEPITAFDYDPAMGVTSEWDWGVWNADMLHARDVLEASGIANQLYMNGTFVGGQTGLLGYFSWGSNDSNFDAAAYESLTFAAGSLGDTAVSTSGRTFLPTSGGQSLVADLVAHGFTAVKGYVGEPLLQGVASPSIALTRYYAGYSMAESMYAASRFVGWEDVILGDPLGTPYDGAPPVALPTYASTFSSSSGSPQTESCSEGSMDVGYITDGSYLAYKAVSLAGATTFVARAASAGPGGTIEVRTDGAAGALLGACEVVATGDWQTWATVTCPLSAASGPHDVYLVFRAGEDAGGGGDAGGEDGGAGAYLFNLEWFAFRP